MSTIEERVAYLEGRMEEHATAVKTLHHRVDELHSDMRRGFEQVDKRFEYVDRRLEQVDRRFEQVDGRLIGLDQKMDRHFTWLVGIQVAVLVSVAGALTGAYFR